MLSILLISAAFAQSWNIGDSIEIPDTYTDNNRGIVTNIYDTGGDPLVLIEGYGGINDQYTLESLGFYRHYPSYNLDQTPPAFNSGVLVPEDVPHHRHIYGIVSVEATATQSAWVSLQVERPNGAACDGTGSFFELVRFPAAVGDTDGSRPYYSANIRPGCAFKFVKSGHALVTESVVTYSYDDE